MLESDISIARNISETLKTELDKLHQYSKRNCIIVSGVPVKDNETVEEIHKKIKNIIVSDIEETPSEKYENEFDKIHRVCPRIDNKQNIIVRFKSHNFPSTIYYNRKKIKNNTVKIKPSLTKQQTKLLKSILMVI